MTAQRARWWQWAGCRWGHPATQVIVTLTGWLIELCPACARAVCDPLSVTRTKEWTR